MSNITCPRCRFRHPDYRSCEDAAHLAEEAAESRWKIRETETMRLEREAEEQARDAERYRKLRRRLRAESMLTGENYVEDAETLDREVDAL